MEPSSSWMRSSLPVADATVPTSVSSRVIWRSAKSLAGAPAGGLTGLLPIGASVRRYSSAAVSPGRTWHQSWYRIGPVIHPMDGAAGDGVAHVDRPSDSVAAPEAGQQRSEVAPFPRTPHPSGTRGPPCPNPDFPTPRNFANRYSGLRKPGVALPNCRGSSARPPRRS